MSAFFTYNPDNFLNVEGDYIMNYNIMIISTASTTSNNNEFATQKNQDLIINL